MLAKKFEDFYSTGEFARAVGKSKSTIIQWDKSGRLKPHHTDKLGYRYYSQSQVDDFLSGRI